MVHHNCQESYRHTLSACPTWSQDLRSAFPGLQDCSKVLWGCPEPLRGHPRGTCGQQVGLSAWNAGPAWAPVLPVWASVLSSLGFSTTFPAVQDCARMPWRHPGGTPAALWGYLRALRWSIYLDCRTCLGSCPSCAWTDGPSWAPVLSVWASVMSFPRPQCCPRTAPERSGGEGAASCMYIASCPCPADCLRLTSCPRSCLPATLALPAAPALPTALACQLPRSFQVSLSCQGCLPCQVPLS